MKKLLFIGIATMCISCSSDSSDEPIAPPENQKGAVHIQTRVDGQAVSDKVKAGLYMVNYLDGKQDELLATDNYVNNQLLTFADNVWSSNQPIYWNDATTPADFYAYAPYQNNVADARALVFSVQKDQTSIENLAQSDFLWGTLQGQSPTESSFDLTLSHMLSQFTINVTAEEGMNIQSEDVSVTIGGTKTTALIDMATSIISPKGDAEDVKCHSNGNLSYTAILIPQQVPFSNFIRIVWNGSPYTLQNAFKLEPKRQYSITVKLKKTESGFDIGIDGWDIIGEDFGGTVGG